MLVSVVSPVFNEEDNISFFVNEVVKTMTVLPDDYEIIIVDDGSADGTLSKVKALAKKVPNLSFIELSRNFGHQIALKAGLDHANGDAVVCLDSDMQHPPSLIPLLIEKWKEGYDIVYTKRLQTEGISKAKSWSSRLFSFRFNTSRLASLIMTIL